jgi:hypothetical protein
MVLERHLHCERGPVHPSRPGLADRPAAGQRGVGLGVVGVEPVKGRLDRGNLKQDADEVDHRLLTCIGHAPELDLV